jgi:hypothetical protein
LSHCDGGQIVTAANAIVADKDFLVAGIARWFRIHLQQTSALA